MKQLLATVALAAIFFARPLSAQISAGAGTNYSQNFDSLTNGSNPNWTNNVTLPGWYLAKSGTNASSYAGGTGSGTTGGLYSFGVAGVNPAADRALGSLASSSAAPIIYGVCFTNDTGLTLTNITVSYAGEQWRNGGSGSASGLAFSYGINNSPITNAVAAAAWINFGALNFTTPTVGSTLGALDGNHATNRQVFANVILTNVVVAPGQELFLRWLDVDDTGSDSALAIDDLSVNFSTNFFPASPLPVAAGTNSTIILMTYNVKGNGSTDWSTNAVQVQAIGREILYLNPDVITFNEIPYTNTWQMVNWVTAYMPGYFLATNSGTDGSIRSVIASRFAINRSQSWLAHADLNPFGYTAANFTRDLFEAEIKIPNWPLPLHVFTTHLKSTAGTTYADAAAKRAAEAAAITNFFATNYFALYPAEPFTLSGDMNDGDTNALAIQRLISAPTTLHLTNPTNPISGSISTYSIQGSVSERIDFIFPGALLATNIRSSAVFRTDLLASFPPNLFSNDDKIASDHLPVLTVFNNPFNTPFKLVSVARTNQNITLQWESQNNRTFNLEASSNLINWTLFMTNLQTSTTNSPFVFATSNVADRLIFFRIYRVP